MSVDDLLRHVEFRTANDTGMFELKRRHDRRIALEQHVECLAVHERAVFERVITGAQRVLDAGVGAAVPGDLEAMVVRLVDHGVHLIKVMHSVWWSLVSGAAASPVGYVFTHSTPSLTSLRTARRPSSAPLINSTSPSMPILRKSGFQSINPPTPQISRPLAASRGPGIKFFVDRALQPKVDIEQAAAAAGRRIAAFERQPGIVRRQQRDVFDRILDVEIFQVGDVEIGRMKVGFDEPGHDRAATGVDHRGLAIAAGMPAAGPA